MSDPGSDRGTKRNTNIDFTVYEKSILDIRQKAKYAELVKWAYFDENIVEAAIRFLRSFEAAQIVWQIDQLLHVNSPEDRYAFHIADIGGGRGIVSYALWSAGYQVTLFDIDESDVCGTGAAKNLFRRTQADIRVITADIEHYDNESGPYDLVFCKQVLHHAVDLNRMVFHMARLVRPGGWVYAFKEHVIRIKGDLPIFLKNHPLSEYHTYENAFTRKAYVNAFRKAGLRNIRYWLAVYTPVPKNFRSTINGESNRIPTAKGLVRLLKREFRLYWPFPGMEFSFIGRKPNVEQKEKSR